MRIAAVAALLVLPAAGGAQTLRLLDTSQLEYRADNGNDVENDDGFGVGRNKLHLAGVSGETSVSAQVDAVLFSGYPDVPDPTPANPSAFRSEARVERLQFTHRAGDLSILVGDHARQIGRGIALSLRKVDELGTDQALRGGAARWEADAFTAEAFAGRTNTENVDPVSLHFREDPDDVIAGATGTLHLGATDVSIYGVYLEPEQATLPAVGEDRTMIGGGFVELPLADRLSIYAEGAYQQRLVGSRDDTGLAAYLAADVDLSVVSLLVEGLLLQRFEVVGSPDPVLNRHHVYNQPPTLERIDQEVLDNRDVAGGRVRISRSLYDGGLVPYVSGMLRRAGPPEAQFEALHGYAGFESTYGGGRSRWNLSGGLRQETDVRKSEPFKTMIHGESQWAQSLGGPWVMHLDVLHESRTLNQDDYVRGSTLLGMERGKLGSLTAEIGYDTQNPEQRNLFLAGIVTWEAAEGVFLRSVFGTQRGGIKCVGGVCRDFPPFSGARVEASVQHDLL